MVGIFIEVVGNVCVFTFFGAGVVLVESCKQISAKKRSFYSINLRSAKFHAGLLTTHHRCFFKKRTV